MTIKDYARIKFLKGYFGNDAGDVVKVVEETDAQIYYYDVYNRYCYLDKDAEGTEYEYIPKGQRLDDKLYKLVEDKGA